MHSAVSVSPARTREVSPLKPAQAGRDLFRFTRCCIDQFANYWVNRNRSMIESASKSQLFLRTLRQLSTAYRAIRLAWIVVEFKCSNHQFYHGKSEEIEDLLNCDYCVCYCLFCQYQPSVFYLSKEIEIASPFSSNGIQTRNSRPLERSSRPPLDKPRLLSPSIPSILYTYPNRCLQGCQSARLPRPSESSSAWMFNEDRSPNRRSIVDTSLTAFIDYDDSLPTYFPNTITNKYLQRSAQLGAPVSTMLSMVFAQCAGFLLTAAEYRCWCLQGSTQVGAPRSTNR
jgi:hypothetical protein